MHSQTGPTIGHSSGWKWDFLCLLRRCGGVFIRSSRHTDEPARPPAAGGASPPPPVRCHRAHDGSDAPQRLLLFMGRDAEWDSSTCLMSHTEPYCSLPGGGKTNSISLFECKGAISPYLLRYGDERLRSSFGCRCSAGGRVSLHLARRRSHRLFMW